MLNRTKIEWVRNEDGSPGYTINPVKGLCPVGCSFCYARRLYQRFKWNPEIRYEDSFWQFHALKKKRPSRVFIGSTMELFGPWIRPEWMHSIISYCKAYPQHTFIFLTKMPENLPKSWPDNCWVGVSVCNDKMLDVAVDKLEDIKATVRFMSFEPLLERLTLSLGYAFYYSGITWALIGQQTPVRTSTTPKVSWIREIVDAADKAGALVFLKNNLFDLLDRDGPEADFAFGIDKQLRQEFPEVKVDAQ